LGGQDNMIKSRKASRVDKRKVSQVCMPSSRAN
jgi:hypothetical protein